MGSVCQMAQRAGRPAARGALEETKEGGCCHFKVCAPLSWSAGLCNSHIIIRGRPRPAAASNSLFGAVCDEFLCQT